VVVHIVINIQIMAVEFLLAIFSSENRNQCNQLSQTAQGKHTKGGGGIHSFILFGRKLLFTLISGGKHVCSGLFSEKLQSRHAFRHLDQFNNLNHNYEDSQLLIPFNR